MNAEQEKYFSFAFNVDPDLNDGYTSAFKQGDEPWWWYTTDNDNDYEGPAAGPVPNFEGATFKSMHQWNEKVL